MCGGGLVTGEDSRQLVVSGGEGGLGRESACV